MRYLIGALFGAVLVLVFFGATTYYHYHQSQRLEDSSQKRSTVKQPLSADSRKGSSKIRRAKANSNSGGYPNNSSRHNSYRQSTSSSSASPQQEPNLYTWKDENGNKVISSQPPATGSYEKLTLPEEGLSVIEMEKAKPIRRKKAQRTTRFASNTQSPALLKQRLISRNKGNCRWLVGRSYDLYTKILQHKGSNRSIYCDEHSKRLREMYKLRKEGNKCFYPYSTPSKC